MFLFGCQSNLDPDVFEEDEAEFIAPDNENGDDLFSNAIIAGKEVGADEVYARSSVAVIYNMERYETANKVCSGTLIGRRLVLTAAHCFDYGQDCKVGFGLNVNDANFELISGKCLVHEQWKSDGVDIALVSLDEDAPPNYEPVKNATLDDPLAVGDEIFLAGYGIATGPYDPQAEATRGILRVTNQTIGRLDSDKKTFTYLNTNGPQGQCSGDSGGSAYIVEPEGQLLLIGVIISGDMDCRQYGKQTDARYFSEWIEMNGMQIPQEEDPPIEQSGQF